MLLMAFLATLLIGCIKHLVHIYLLSAYTFTLLFLCIVGIGLRLRLAVL